MKKALLSLAAACALLATSATAFAASPAAYRAKVNGICKAGVAKINAVPAPKSPKDYEHYFQTEGTLSYQLLKQVVGVTPPKSLQPLVLGAVKLQGKLVDGVLAIAAQIRKGADPAKAYHAADPGLTKLGHQVDAAWRRAGLNACAG